VGDKAEGQRGCAWRRLLDGFWTKQQAVMFALQQIENANQLAANSHNQELLEELQVEAIAELSRKHQNDRDVAQALSGIAAGQYTMSRLHRHLITFFVQCPEIAQPLAAQLKIEHDSSRAAWLFQGIAAHLTVQSEHWALLERSAHQHFGEFKAENLSPLILAAFSDPRTPALLRAFCERLPSNPTRSADEADILRLYMTHYGRHGDQVWLCHRISMEGTGELACQAMHWLGRIYGASDATMPLLVDRVENAPEIALRTTAFYILILNHAQSPTVVRRLFARARTEPNVVAREEFTRMLDGNQRHSARNSLRLPDAEGWAETENFNRQVKLAHEFRPD
jgi:hypothetical protein